MRISNALLIAAATGILAGAAAQTSVYGAEGGQTAAAEAGDKNACKGMNACKGKGGCKTDKNACKGQGWVSMLQDECKNHGGHFENS